MALRVAETGDQLTAVGSTTIAYDEIGNPTTYNGYDLTWHGRQLKEMEKTNSVIKFLYNADGIRTNKIVNGTNHIYTLNETQIVSEAWGSNLLIFLYDESGSPIGMQYRSDTYAANTFTTFYFEKNLQGDVVAIYNESGVKVLSYNYDAWGNPTTTWHNSYGVNMYATYNPFRYRGYYYDTETGLYYLQSRYYNPQWGRFLNADGYVNANGDLIGFNMYAYCSNSPVMYVDYSGKFTVSCMKDEAAFPGMTNIGWGGVCGGVAAGSAAYYIYTHVKEDLENCDRNNEDIQTVLDAHYLAMYKGQLVIKSTLLGKTAFSFGVIVLGRGANNERVLRHEWGHTQQLKEMGVFKYCYAIAFPSLGHAAMDMFGIYDIKHYYSLPWEYDADLKGGVIGWTYTSDVDDRHATYFGAFRQVEEVLKKAITSRPHMPSRFPIV